MADYEYTYNDVDVSPSFKYLEKRLKVLVSRIKFEFSYSGNRKELIVYTDDELTIDEENTLNSLIDTTEYKEYLIECKNENKYYVMGDVTIPTQCPNGHTNIVVNEISLDRINTIQTSINDVSFEMFVTDDGNLILAKID